MSMRRRTAPLFATALAALPAFSCAAPREPTQAPITTTVLRDGWQIRSSAGLAASGAEISRPGFAAPDWTATTAPSTVLAALVRAGEYPDPYFGDNLERIPTARFDVPWWYRTEFTLPDPLPENARLVFEGINYSAEVWLNGERIATRAEMTGAFRVFDLDVTARLAPGSNGLAVQVFPPRPGDPTIGFVDWNPRPPDRSLGVWREVKLRATGQLSLEDVFVTSEVDLETVAEARLTISARLKNHADRALAAKLTGRLEGIELVHEVQLLAGEERLLKLTPAELPQLAIRSPRLWWPNNLGEPHLYRLELVAAAAGKVSDHREVEFGIREVADYLDADGQRGYTVNGRKILIRGGGWVDDLLLADDDRRLEDQIRYVRHMNLNTIRLEGFWGSSQKLFELADRYGILVWVGWSCQWEWENYLGQPVDEEFGGIDTPAEIELVTRSFADQVVRLRNHPSVMVWNLASDMLPRPELETRYRELLAELDPTRPPLAACSVRTSTVSGPTGVKMNGPYEWVPPEYWYLDSERGGAYGFNTETGPGAQPPPAPSLKRMLPREHWWPIDSMWSFHSGRNEFANVDRYVKALDARYGKSGSLEEFAEKAQLANYEAMRPMFEAFSLRRPKATGVVQWMLNSAWPDLFWQLYDWYLVPNGAYFAARKANQPVHIAYDYGERKVVAVNDLATSLTGVAARIRVLDTGSKVLLDERRPLDVAAASRADVLSLPKPATGGKPWFLDLRLIAGDGAELASNFYWLAAEPDVLDWPKSEWFYTPVRRFADLTSLASLPAARLEVTHSFAPTKDGRSIEVTLLNQGPTIAFFVELAVSGSDSGLLAAPILWDDNYVSLLPGERREIRGSFPTHALSGADRPVFSYHGINVRSEGTR